MASIENNIKVFIFLSVLVLFPNFAYANEKLTNQNLHDFYALFEKSKMKGPDSLIEFFGKHLHPDYKYSIASHHIIYLQKLFHEMRL